MDNYLGRVVGEVAHAGKQNPEIDLTLFPKKRIFIFFSVKTIDTYDGTTQSKSIASA